VCISLRAAADRLGSHVQEAVRKQPSKSALWLALAELYMKLGKSGDSVRTLNGMLAAIGSTDSVESLMVKAKAQLLTAQVLHVCVCVCVSLHVCMHSAIDVYMKGLMVRAKSYLSLFISISVCTCTRVYVCMYVCICTHKCTCMYLYT
jgi:hypothetical protein